jgi:cell wall-associated NlpC family hydrolase
MSFNQSGTFAYSPDVACSIYTRNGIVDVSQDIIDFTITRQMNAVSQMNMTLANPGRKYNRKINTMDRVTVFLKRTSWIQVFTGYITFAPIETLVPTPVSIAADCTLRILQTTYWDDQLSAFQQLLMNSSDTAAQSSDATLNDGGVAQMIINLLVDVCGWNQNNIHIQSIPFKFIEYASQAYTSQISASTGTLDQNVINNLITAIDANSYINGKSNVTGGLNSTNTHSVTQSGAPAGTKFTVLNAQAFYTTPLTKHTYSYTEYLQTNSAQNGINFNTWQANQTQRDFNTPGDNPMNPVNGDAVTKDIYWCNLPFVYSTYTDQSKIDSAKDWIKHNYVNNNNTGRFLTLTNYNTNKSIALRATGVLQKPNATVKNKAVIITDIANANYIQVHPAVVAYLNGQATNDDPTKVVVGNAPSSIPTAPIFISWSSTDVKDAGPINITSNQTTDQIKSALGITTTNNAAILTNAIDVLLTAAQAQVGAIYSQDGSGPHYRETPANGSKVGAFDCSGFTQWCYKQIGISIGGVTTTQWGTGNSSDNATHGAFLGNNTPPQAGDLIFWNTYKSEQQPGHVSMCLESFDPKTGKGAIISANGTGRPLSINRSINWKNLKGGGILYNNTKDKIQYMGARRPLTLHPGWGISSSNNSSSVDPNNPSSALLNINSSFSNLMGPPVVNPIASALVGTPRAFLLDNNVMADFQQIMGAGLRNYMSAPNGDFVGWFSDFYGIFGTDPCLEISPVEIVDFQIYHDDNQLVTHYGVVGDTSLNNSTGAISNYLTSNGIISIEDGSTMNIMFGGLKNLTNTTINALNFLQRYGLRPMVQSQNMIKSHSMEYMYGLYGFMNQWANQFASTINLTFMPELYPGMRVSMNIDNEAGSTDNYEFYCTAVTHQGSRSSGFTTQAVFTAPKKNGNILDYGYDYVWR